MSATYPPPIDVDNLGRGPMVVAVTWVFTAIAMFTVGLWLYVRKSRKFARGWDDWLMSLAVVIRFASQVQITYSLKYGMGKHDRSLTPQQLVMILKYNWTALPGAVVTSILARIAIAILLIRLFGVHRWFTVFLICNTLLLAASGIALIPVTFLQFQPTEALWNIMMPNATHWDPRVWLYLAYFVQSLCTFTDLTYVLIPVVIIWKLNLPMGRKLGLAMLMGMSLFTMGMSICKTIWIASASKATQESVDVQYDASFQVLFGVLEQDLVIIIGCIPSLRSLAHLDFARLKSWGSSISVLLSRRRDGSASSFHRGSAANSPSLNGSREKKESPKQSLNDSLEPTTIAYHPWDGSKDDLEDETVAKARGNDMYSVSTSPVRPVRAMV